MKAEIKIRIEVIQEQLFQLRELNDGNGDKYDSMIRDLEILKEEKE